MKIEQISKGTPACIDAAAKYDADHFFEADRMQFMKKWVVQEGMISLIATHAVTGDVKGLVCARPDDQGYGIGPLYAEDAVTAKDLLFAIQNELPKDASFLVDVPDKNIAGVDLLKNELGMSFVFDCVRMYTKRQPAKPDVNRVFGNCTLQLG